jgi:hypothetical protein
MLAVGLAPLGSNVSSSPAARRARASRSASAAPTWSDMAIRPTAPHWLSVSTTRSTIGTPAR